MDYLPLPDSAARQVIDSTFQRKEGQNETAINAKGFEVDFLRLQAAIVQTLLDEGLLVSQAGRR